MAEFPVAIITDEFTQDFEHICETAVRMSIPALEIRTVWNKNIVDMSDSEIGEIGKMAKAAGLEIVSIASPVYKCTLPDGGDIDHRFEQDAFQAAHTYDDQPRILNRAIVIAEKLEARIIRVFSFWRTTDPSRLTDRVIDALRTAIDAASPKGLVIGLENEHACNLATAAEAAPVMRAIESPHFGLVWDPANAYVAGEDPFPGGYDLLPGGRIVHIHAKDGVMPAESDRMNWCAVGDGKVGWKGQLSRLVADGYAGMISLETHWGGPDGDKFEGSKICARNLQELVKEAA